MARSTQVKTIRITNGSGVALTGVLVQLRRGATTYSMEEVGNGYYKNDAVLPSEYNVFVDSVDTGQTVPVGAGEIDRLDTFDNASSIFVTDAGGNSSLVEEIPISNVDGLQTELDSKASSADLDDKFDKAGGVIIGDTEVQAVLTIQDLVVLDTLAGNVSQTSGINSDTQTALDSTIGESGGTIKDILHFQDGETPYPNYHTFFQNGDTNQVWAEQNFNAGEFAFRVIQAGTVGNLQRWLLGSSDGTALTDTIAEMTRDGYLLMKNGIDTLLGDLIFRRNGVVKQTHGDTQTTITQNLDVQGEIIADSADIQGPLTADTVSTDSFGVFASDGVKLDANLFSDTVFPSDLDTLYDTNSLGVARETGGFAHGVSAYNTSETESNTAYHSRFDHVWMNNTAEGMRLSSDMTLSVLKTKVNGATNFGRLSSAPTANASGDTYFQTTGTVIGWFWWNGTSWLQFSEGKRPWLDLIANSGSQITISQENIDYDLTIFRSSLTGDANLFSFDSNTGIYTYLGENGLKFDGMFSFACVSSSNNNDSIFKIYVDTGSGFQEDVDSSYPVELLSSTTRTGVPFTTAVLNSGDRIKLTLRCENACTVTFSYGRKHVREVS